MDATCPAASARALQTPAPTSPPAPASLKHALRTRTLAARAAQGDRAASDAARLPRLLGVTAGHVAVAAYASIGDEPDTWGLIEALHAAGVRVLLPVLTGRRTPGWAWHTGRDGLRAGWRGILMPSGPALGPEALAEVSLVWVSALLVTPGGARLGTGGGWYDRALPFRHPDAAVATLVNDSEVVEALPTEPHDVPVGVVVTPSRVLRTE